MSGRRADPGAALRLQHTLYRSRNPTRRWLHVTRRDWIMAQIRRWQGPPPRALEVGPGSGVYLPALAAVARQVLTTDTDPACLQHARQLARELPALEVCRDNIAATGLPDNSFDLVLCSEVIEHIADSAAALRGLARVLAPGGMLIVTTPQRFSTLELCARVAFLPGILQLVRWVYREPVMPSGHINLLAESSLRRQFDAAGLVVQSSFKSGFYLPLVAEFGGRPGLRLLRWCEYRLRHSRLSWLLWTQYYVLTHGDPEATDATVDASP